MILMLLCTIAAQAQIVIGGNVYGGGNKGKVAGNTNVTVKAVDEVNNVFGGARMANVGGHAYVHIDGEDATGDILIPNVFGGNDIAGTIGSSTVPVATYYTEEEATAYNTEHGLSSGDPGSKSKGDLKESGLTDVLTGSETKESNPEKNAIDDSWNAFVRTSRSVKNGKEDKWLLVGNLYGGGNGEYYYDKKEEYVEGTGETAVTKVKYDVYLLPQKDGDKPIATISVEKGKDYLPVLGKTYLELKGGELAHVYGGGNNATVTENTTISINNESDVCQKYVDALAATIGITSDALFKTMSEKFGINTFQTNLTNLAFNHARVFGGNNKADMAIRPTWNLQQGVIRDLYSGGNEGRMTSSTGLLLEIDPITANKDKLVVENVYGGCRRSDVRPLDASGADISPGNPEGYNFPTGLSARTLVRGGKIKNVYGGNDISGTVYGGNAVGIYTNVSGDVYGGGNGSYAYTDNPTLGAMDIYKDFYYNPDQVWKDAGFTSVDEMLVKAGYTSTEINSWSVDKRNQLISAISLNKFRPNAEQVSIRLKGYPSTQGRPDYTIIHRGVYCGGNSASMDSKKNNPLMEIKFGSYVIADSVFLGNNGEKMIDPNILKLYAKYVDDKGDVKEVGTEGCHDYSTLNLKDDAIFAEYMEGVVMTKQPDVVFDGDVQSDKEEDKYIENSSYVGSFFCGGNVGSMAIPGNNSYSVSHGLNIFDKFVGGCNDADILEGEFNAAYEGGVLGAKDERGDITSNTNFYTNEGTEEGSIKDRLEINLENLTITPLRWQEDENGEETKLVWNTNKWSEEDNKFIPLDENEDVNDKTRLLGGNVYGGCFNSGHVNGNVVININEDVLKRDEVFGSESNGVNGNPPSGVVLESQRSDVMAVALSVFGAGYGEETEIWGSTTVNLNKGYVFQIFGGGQEGVVGKKNSEGKYVFDERYSSTVNLSGRPTATSSTGKVDDLAETEFIYGGGNEGDVCGNTYVNLGSGRVYDAFGGASDADILGHAETYIGRQPNGSPGTYKDGFPWIQDIVYGGNDFGGTIHSKGDFTDRVRVKTGTDAFDVLGKVHKYDATSNTADVLQANAYVEYLQGRVDSIFGGSYGYYDYTLDKFKDEDGNAPNMPSLESTFVNIRPNKVNNTYNQILGVFGGGTGWPGNRDGDLCQNRSYVLIDIPDNLTKFQTMEVFGAGSYNGLGMKSRYDATTGNTYDADNHVIDDLDNVSAIIDLVRGKVGAAYGGSYKEGVTRRTMVNVPRGSTINIGSIFGGAYGNDLLAPCDVYEAHVNYSSADALLIYSPNNELSKGAIYGGNNTCRRTLYGFIDIDAPVRQQHPDYGITRGKVYGAGYGPMTWSEYTEVNLNKKPDGVEGDYTGAEVFEVYGGAQEGEVLNAESATVFMNQYLNAEDPNFPSYLKDLFNERGYNADVWARIIWPDAWTLGKGYYTPYNENGVFAAGNFNDYVTNTATNLSNPMVRVAEMDDRDYSDTRNKAANRNRYNTNVIINEGAYVANYAYGGGLGDSNQGTGDVYGTTYIALLGGTVNKDLYAAGTSGVVYDFYNSNEFIASSNAYIKGGTARNVYGGGWEGSVGKHTKINAGLEVAAGISDSPDDDILGETHVIIGDIGGTSFTDGIPAIQRNAYGGGEGGAVYGTANITINNGYIGYAHLLANQKFDDEGKTVAADASEGLTERYVEKIIDETYKDKETNKFIPNRNLEAAGCVFGGGYVDNSSVDMTNVQIYGGNIRNSVFGGGEVAAIGRGTIEQTTSGEDIIRTLSGLYRPGKTHLEMYGGKVNRNVFGGGRGYDNLGKYGKLHADGCVFGQTEVHIHGGEIGSAARMDYGDGNVFGGGDIGYVYSAFEENGTFYKGVKIGERYGTDAHQGYYFKHKWEGVAENDFIMDGTENIFTEDCKVLVEPHCKSSADLSFTGITYAQGEKLASIDWEYLKANRTTYASQFANIDSVKMTAINGITFDRSYPAGSYVPIAALNTMSKKGADERWNNLDPTGIIIHNAVFAGGNTPSGKSVTNANVASVFGNATASIHDIYHRDMITLGTRHQGGLYGDGNLTLVDGYRELNITNYGTDYYAIKENQEISLTDYYKLPDREAAYYELRYKCVENCTDKEGTNYKKSTTEGGVATKASTITADEMLTMFLREKKVNGVIQYVEGTQTPIMESIQCAYPAGSTTLFDVLVYDNTKHEWKPNTKADGTAYFWVENGVLPMYAGRLLNSIQRADFCGVWGSRMVLQGARDRVTDEVTSTNYTINRVREVSLNKKHSVISSDTGDAAMHGNYFGIYSIVNYLGALTSDVDFGDDIANTYDSTKQEWLYDVRTTDNDNHEVYDPDLDPSGATITLKDNLSEADKTAALTAADKIDGVTVSGETITVSSTETTTAVEALYKLRSVPNIEITATKLTNQTFYEWKKIHRDERKRNNGNSHNKVALASGVYLELTTEESTGNSLNEKVWGPITGVVELDLINVSPGIGGGFVYAKNVHGVRRKTGYKNTTLTALNNGAVTKWDYIYNPPDHLENESLLSENDKKEWQTSGNFVHSTQTIIDDCYNISNRYAGDDAVPAHYWYIKGSVYVYDQYISAYTGSSNAFSETVDMPLTITAASHGSMKLLDVKPNRYAYYSAPGVKLTTDKKIVINDVEYKLNDPISYWDWYLLPASERALFIENTYVNCVAVNIDNATEGGEPIVYEPGTYVMNESDYQSFGNHTYTNAEGETILDADKNPATTSYIFRPSNNLGHDTGYILTYQVNNPAAWDTWYTPKNEDSYTYKITKKEYNDTKHPVNKDDYEDGPTYCLDVTKLNEGQASAVLGQNAYKVGDLIPQNIETNYPYKNNKPDGQATFERAYIVTDDATIEETTTTENGTVTTNRHLNPGAAIPASKTTGITDKVDEAFICTKTIQITKTDLIYKDTKMTEKQMNDDYITPLYTEIRKILPTEKIDDARLKAIRSIEDLTEAEQTSLSLTDDQKTALKPLLSLKNNYSDYLVAAYYCTAEGKYGGREYKKGQNYRGLEAWSSMSEDDRNMFVFNYDALDLLIDKNYGGAEGKKYQYDGEGYTTKTHAMENLAQYSLERTLNYTATYKGSDTGTYNTITLQNGKEYDGEDYEKLPNEQRHYVAIHVKDGNQVTETTGEGEGAVTTYYKVYVVNQSFQIGSTPYAIGSTISQETYLGLSDNSNITVLTFPTSEANNTYYYCRESYKVGYNGNGTEVTNEGANFGTKGYDADGNKVTIATVAYTNTTDSVPIGLLIDESTYSTLKDNNKQKDFTFHGSSPMETSTLYVSNESDIYDLSKDKIITVIYQYDYDESDVSGNVTPVSERHVLNIHIKFESGVPTIDDITPPDIILPGYSIDLGEPAVKPGAYEVTGGGWELFENSRDAESHSNGTDYDPTSDLLYWYQHEWYVAYYAKTYLGRSYSNAVPIRVANYHDLAEVMSDANKTHHMYIDHAGVKRASKIYIKDYSGTDQNGLDLLKDLFDLSLVARTYDEKGNPIPIASDKLKGHVPMESRVEGCSNLEFFMRTDIDHSPVTKTNPAYDPENPGDTPATITTGYWTPIASGATDKCFDGTFHGDGHTISGLTPNLSASTLAEKTGSLFGKLCGSVYNLGVQGSFNGAGIADTGDGYVESCWVKSTNTTPLESKPYAVFGNPTDETDGVYQVVNSYFWNGNKGLYQVAGDEPDVDDDKETITSGGVRGKATAKSSKAFYNGELAYDLNNFYLHKRYANEKGTVVENNTNDRYLTLGNNNELAIQPFKAYADRPDLCSSGYIYTISGSNKKDTLTYVESRYANEDFRYAGGTIPSSKDDRYYTETVKDKDGNDVEESGYYPIWPDDYIFFGQKLTYGYSATEAHQDVPTAIAKTNGRLAQDESANRVYRAPAYYRSKEMGVAHFNPNVYLAQRKSTQKDGKVKPEYPDTLAYPGMTAIDFAGHNGANVANGTFGLGTPAGTKWFYLPLLDDDGLQSIVNCDETQNLLVYAPLSSATKSNEYANEKTCAVLNRDITDPEYNSYYNNADGYRIVGEADISSLQGHLVQATLTNGELTATNDHLLVDKQDFNAPIGYRFTSGKRMWYQRDPGDDEYVTPEWTGTPAVRSTKGWQGISLPFTAELVTTHQKGEITHFYSGSETSKNSDKKIGHEYWLRYYKDINVNENENQNENVAKANFTYPDATAGDKNYTNTFLWDYYYSKGATVSGNAGPDKNNDTYQTYYKKSHKHEDYPLLEGKTPYIIGFPGQTYYEFDLSGNFVAQNTKNDISRLDKQTITFASNTGISIGVSDDEMGGVKKAYNGKDYIFKPSYMNEELPTGTFVLNSDGNAYTQLSETETTNTTNKVKASQYAFRPYFVATASTTGGSRVTRSIIFSNDVSDLGKDQDQRNADQSGTLNARAGRRLITVSSTMSEAVSVRILNTAGQTLAEFNIQPGETVETRVNISGVYVIQSADGHYTKKLSVR